MTAFTNAMNGLRAYHKARLVDENVTAPATRRLFSATNVNNINDVFDVAPEVARELDVLKVMSQDLAEKQNEGMEMSIIADTQVLSNAGATPTATENFKQKMNERREREKQLSSQNIDKIFDSAIQIGERHPAAQDAIMSTTDLITNLFREMSKLFNEFLSKVSVKLSVWLTTAFQDIKANFGKIGGWIRGWFGSAK